MSDRTLIHIVTGKLVINIIIRRRAVITSIMHGNELEKINTLILAVVLKKMRDQLGYPEQLPDLRITGEVNRNQQYEQGVTHSQQLNIQK